MASRLDRSNTRHDIVAGLNETELFGNGLRVRAEDRCEIFEVAGELSFGRPEIMLDLTDDVARVGE